MGLATVHSRAQVGLAAPPVNVEVHLLGGLPRTQIVGLPEKAVKESKERIRGTLSSLNFSYPRGHVIVNLAPADLPKEGSRFDLPIALAILAASGQLPARLLGETEFVGELALSGALRPVNGVLPAVIAAHRADRAIVIPRDNGPEAAYSAHPTILPADSLPAVCAHLFEQGRLQPLRTAPPTPTGQELQLDDIRGQHAGKRALQIAAAGGHNLLMLGPPGTGKTMLASRLVQLLPPLATTESLEVATIYSVTRGRFAQLQWGRRPFRAPHHTASPVAIAGGGNPPAPGEISLAHKGVLFLDELPEFGRKVLEVLREPLETGEVVISRAARQVAFPARFQLVAAMNPCPCGYHGDRSGRCLCSEERILSYRRRVSGPLLDRIDLHVLIPAVPIAELLAPPRPGERGAGREVYAGVMAARTRMLERTGHSNAELTTTETERCCQLTEGDRKLLARALEQFRLSARAYYRILRVARTIADLAGSAEIETAHVTEALSLRLLDRGNGTQGSRG